MDAERLERVRLLWEGDAVQDTSLLWRIYSREAETLDHLVDLIESAGARDPALEVYADTLAAMREIASDAEIA